MDYNVPSNRQWLCLWLASVSCTLFQEKFDERESYDVTEIGRMFSEGLRDSLMK